MLECIKKLNLYIDNEIGQIQTDKGAKISKLYKYACELYRDICCYYIEMNVDIPFEVIELDNNINKYVRRYM